MSLNAYETQYTLFHFTTYAIYALFILALIGAWSSAPQYLSIIQAFMQIYVGLFLVYRFNPFMSHTRFSDLDRRVAYTAGVFVLATTSLATYLKSIAAVVQKRVL